MKEKEKLAKQGDNDLGGKDLQVNYFCRHML